MSYSIGVILTGSAGLIPNWFHAYLGSEPGCFTTFTQLEERKLRGVLFEQHDICIEIISEMHRSAYSVSLNQMIYNGAYLKQARKKRMVLPPRILHVEL